MVLYFPQDAQIHLADVVSFGREMVSSFSNPVLGLNSDMLEEISRTAACSFFWKNWNYSKKLLLVIRNPVGKNYHSHMLLGLTKEESV